MKIQIKIIKSFKFPTIFWGEVEEGSYVYPYFTGYKKVENVHRGEVSYRLFLNLYLGIVRVTLNIRKWFVVCDYCDFVAFSKEKVETHEQIVHFNPNI